MVEVTGNAWRLWDADLSPNAWIMFPSNFELSSNGLVMGKGMALAARERFPDLPAYYRQLILSNKQIGVRPLFSIAHKVIAFPTKIYWRSEARLEVIESVAKCLVPLLDKYKVEKVYTVRLGCGLGKRKWSEVQPILAKYFPDNIIVATPFL